jgi:hypothetical protein
MVKIRLRVGQRKPLHHVNRINLQIDMPEVMPILFKLCQSPINHAAHLFPATRFYEQLHTMFAAQSREWRRRGTENATGVIAIGSIQVIPKLLGNISGSCWIFVPHE